MQRRSSRVVSACDLRAPRCLLAELLPQWAQQVQEQQARAEQQESELAAVKAERDALKAERDTLKRRNQILETELARSQSLALVLSSIQ